MVGTPLRHEAQGMLGVKEHEEEDGRAEEQDFQEAAPIASVAIISRAGGNVGSLLLQETCEFGPALAALAAVPLPAHHRGPT